MEINNSMLEDQPSSDYTNIIQEQYTVQQIGNEISDITDIEKYSFKRIVAVVDRDKIMDHICFPHLFCTGKGGMYDDRKVEITPSMFAKWILKQ
jgi:hypothetical protein